MAKELTFSSVGIEHPERFAREAGEPSQAALHLFTPSGQGRRVLTEDDLIKLLDQASHVLAILRKR